MKSLFLETDNPSVHLIEPELERDAQLGAYWLHGDKGRDTLRLMGIPEQDNRPTTLEQERQRVSKFINNPTQLNWMIEYDGQVVGSIWVDLEPKENLPCPSVHIMIGNPNMRGKGIGFVATSSVVEHLEEQGYKNIYSRYLMNNIGSKSLLRALKFRKSGDPYTDQDNLEWQNVKRQLSEINRYPKMPNSK